MRLSLAGAWNLGKLLVADSRQRQDLVMLHLPAPQVAALKALAAGGSWMGGWLTPTSY